ncbi:hypothetical protein MKX03_019893 [Papaver bracteatum]|nr:hypothetical protein MKX03_019893 [Papaver bracteatum]
MGCHIDGFISVVAHTHVLQEGPVTGTAADVIGAANTAAEVALRLVRPGKKASAWLKAGGLYEDPSHDQFVKQYAEQELRKPVNLFSTFKKRGSYPIRLICLEALRASKSNQFLKVHGHPHFVMGCGNGNGFRVKWDATG